MFVPQGPSQAALQSMAKTDLASVPRDIFSTRNPETIQKGIGNLLQNSNTPAYKDAMAALTKNVGIYNTGVPLIMGTTGIMGVDESNALKQEYDVATAKNQEDADKFNARIKMGFQICCRTIMDGHYFVSKILYNDRRSADPDWKIHECFYLNIGKHLAPDGTIIMQEQAYASGTKSFEKFIDQGGLRIVDVYWEPVDQMHLYYIDLTHK
jgi:hypothetical protein